MKFEVRQKLSLILAGCLMGAITGVTRLYNIEVHPVLSWVFFLTMVAIGLRLAQK